MAPTRWFLLAMVSILVVAAWGASSAQETVRSDAGKGGVLVRVDGNVTVPANESIEVLVLVGDGSHANVSGTAHVVVVVDGRLDLWGNITEQLVLVNAHAVLHNGSLVAGDISLSGSTLDQRNGSAVLGGIDERRPLRVLPVVGIVFGIMFLVGVPIAVFVAGVSFVLLFPRQVRAVTGAMTSDPGGLFMAFVGVWILLPLVAFLALFTIVGLPTGLGIVLLFLPVLWLLGYLVAGVRIGRWLFRGRTDRRRTLAAATMVGLALLMLVGIVPFVGWLAGFVAGLWGASALVREAWLAARRDRQRRHGGLPPPPPPPEPAPPSMPAGP